MVKIGIICEFNPIHAGHIRLFERVREHFGDCAVICIMSGNFTQRGIPAVFPKYRRAEAAIRCGANAVYELPFPWCSAPAPYFARGGVAVARAAGCDVLAFGSECGDIAVLSEARDNLDDVGFREYLGSARKDARHSSESGVRILNRCYREYWKKSLPAGANNTLALEYLAALRSLAPEITPFTVRREGAATASASRELISAGDFGQLPGSAADVLGSVMPTDYRAFDLLSFGFMREHSSRELARFADGSGGFAGGLFRLSRQSGTPGEFFASCADKRMTSSRARRFILACMCSVTPAMWEELPHFSALLAMDGTGRACLPADSGDFAVITKPASYRTFSGDVVRQFEKGITADSLFGLCCGECADDALRKTPFIRLDNGE